MPAQFNGNQGEIFQPMRVASFEGIGMDHSYSGQNAQDTSFQRHSMHGIMNSPNTTNSMSQKTWGTGSNQRSSFTRGGKATAYNASASATTAFDSVQTGPNSRGNERGCSYSGFKSVQNHDINQFSNWMPFGDATNSKNISTAKKEF